MIDLRVEESSFDASFMVNKKPKFHVASVVSQLTERYWMDLSKGADGNVYTFPF